MQLFSGITFQLQLLPWQLKTLNPCHCFYLALFFFSRLYNTLMHQSFVTVPHHLRGNRGDDVFSSITTLLKALHCGDLLRIIAMLFITVNSMGVYLRNITSLALILHCRWTQKDTALHISPCWIKASIGYFNVQYRYSVHSRNLFTGAIGPLS